MNHEILADMDALVEARGANPADDRSHERLWHLLASQHASLDALDALDACHAEWVELRRSHGPAATPAFDGFMMRYRAEVAATRQTVGSGSMLDLAVAFAHHYRALHADLYRQIAFVDRLFKRHGIQYWIVSGTLLAAVRHQRLIPWDRDVDLEIAEDDIPRLAALEGELRRGGMYFKRARAHHYKLDDQFDVFAWDKRPMHRRGNELFPIPDERWPLRTYRLGELLVPGPGHAERSLARSYGADWRTRGRVWNHMLNDYWRDGHDPTRYVVDIDALHRALGWQVTEPGEVEPEPAAPRS